MCYAFGEAQHFSSKTDYTIGSVMPAPGANGARPFSSGKRARKIGKHVRHIVLSLGVMLFRGKLVWRRVQRLPPGRMGEVSITILGLLMRDYSMFTLIYGNLSYMFPEIKQI